MPLYEYRCNACQTRFELLRRMADREVVAVCPGCESRTTMPLISRVGQNSHGASALAGLPTPASAPSGGGGGCCGGGCGGG